MSRERFPLRLNPVAELKFRPTGEPGGGTEVPPYGRTPGGGTEVPPYGSRTAPSGVRMRALSPAGLSDDGRDISTGPSKPISVSMA